MVTILLVSYVCSCCYFISMFLVLFVVVNDELFLWEKSYIYFYEIYYIEFMSGILRYISGILRNNKFLK